MNYNHADWVYRKYGLTDRLRPEYFAQVEQKLSADFAALGIPLQGAA